MFRGDRLKTLREKHGYTHAELADLLNIGFAQIYRFESGKGPSSDVLIRIADLFDVSADYLLGLTPDPDAYRREDNLSRQEQHVIDALRRGDKVEAVKAIVGE